VIDHRGEGLTMPGKLQVLVVLMALNMLLSAVQLIFEMKTFTVIGLALNGFLLYSVIKGNESVRRLLIVLSWLGLILNGVGLVLIVPALSLMLGTIAGIVMFIATAIGIARCAYTIWALNAPEVQQWMYKRSMGLSDSESL
jgi:hypothetical protein